MSDCTHDCSTCGESCADREGGGSPFQIKPLRDGCRVGKVYGVVSGKGGVGKSMVTSQLAVTMPAPPSPRSSASTAAPWHRAMRSSPSRRAPASS